MESLLLQEVNMNSYVKKVSHTLILGLIIFLVCYILIFFINEKIELPNGTLTSRNRLTGQVLVKPIWSDNYFIEP